jgi:NAD+ synthase
MTNTLKTIDKINVCIDYIKRFFKETNGKRAIIGISGGKDSTVAAALCVQALGKENVFGVLMPNGLTSGEAAQDLEDGKTVCKFLGIKYHIFDIHEAYNSLLFNVENLLYCQNSETENATAQTKINLAPRIRMSVLYAIAQSMNGRVINTTNACERFVGYGTLFGDTVGDLALLKNLTVSEIYEIGDALGLPYDLVHKTPADGLTGKSDEEVLGVSYEDIEKYLKAERKSYLLKDEGYAFYQMKDEMNIDTFEKINELAYKSEFKRQIINVPGPEFN